jgi:hypothetical protein
MISVIPKIWISTRQVISQRETKLTHGPIPDRSRRLATCDGTVYFRQCVTGKDVRPCPSGFQLGNYRFQHCRGVWFVSVPRKGSEKFEGVKKKQAPSREGACSSRLSRYNTTLYFPSAARLSIDPLLLPDSVESIE